MALLGRDCTICSRLFFHLARLKQQPSKSNRSHPGGGLSLSPTPTVVKRSTSLRLHDRYSERKGTFELVPGDAFAALMELETITEKYPGGGVRTLLPLTRLVLELVAWAREAHEIKPGRK